MSGGRRVAALVVAVALAVVGCSDADRGDATTTTADAGGPSETLPVGTTLRLGVAPDLLPALAAQLVGGALRAQGATVVVVPLARTADAEAALGDRVDVAVVLTDDPDALRAGAFERGWVAVDEVAGDLGGGTGVVVVTTAASAELGDLLEATVGGVVASLGVDTLARLAAAIVEEGRPTDEVVETYLVDVGLIDPGGS